MSAVENKSVPEYLNDEEMNFILDVIPKVNAGIKEIGEKIRTEIIYKQKLLLRDHKIYKDNIINLKREIINHWRRSTIEPGIPIGLLTGEALGSQATQSNLNTFHHAGSLQSVGSGTTVELLNATQYRKNESTILHFKDKNLSFDDILDLEKKIVGITVGMICLNIQIIKTDTFKKDWWYDFYIKYIDKKEYKSKYFMRLKFDTNLLYKYKVSLNDIAKKLENNGKVLSCVPSPIKNGIIDIYPIENLIKETLIKNLTDPDDKDIEHGINDNNSSLLFLDICVKPFLNNILIKGISKIKKLIPVETNVMSIIKSMQLINNDKWIVWLDLVKIRTSSIPISKLIIFLEESGCIIENKTNEEFIKNPFEEYENNINKKFFITPDEKDDRILLNMPKNWKIRENYNNPIDFFNASEKNEKLVGFIDTFIIKENHNIWEMQIIDKLNIEDINYIIKELNKNKITVKNNVIFDNDIPTSLIIEMPNHWEKNNFETPEQFFKNLVDREEEKASAFIRNEKIKGNSYPIYNYTSIYKASKYNYAELIGNNLKALISLDFVDSKKTISNSPHDIFHTFGIEAARNFIAHTFYDIILNSGSYVNYRYTDFVADFMTSLGNISAITSKGVIKHNRGALADATFQEPLTRFISSSIFGPKENVSSTSASIFTGVRMKLGTGYSQYSLDNSVIDILKKVDISSFLEEEKLKDLKEEETFIHNEQNLDFGQGDLFGDLNDINFDNIKLFSQESSKKSVPKGPIPDVFQSLFVLPEFLQNIINKHKKVILPPLGDLNITKIIENITNNLSFKEHNVEFIDSSLIINHIKEHLNPIKDEDVFDDNL